MKESRLSSPIADTARYLIWLIGEGSDDKIPSVLAEITEHYCK